MSWQLASLAGAAAAPWRNGGGTTRELLAWPRAGDWQVRISVADVAQDGPFSAYPGIARWFAVLEGAGVRLRIGQEIHAVHAGGEPLHFDGAALVQCELVAGATRDLNLMCPPGRGLMRRVAGTGRFGGSGPRLAALYAHAAPARLDGQEVAAGTLAWRVAEATGDVLVEARDAVWMEVRL